MERASGDERRALCALYEQDKRTGVQKLLISYRKQELAKEQELLRLEGMCTYEKKYRSYDRICGIDEVGRGPFSPDLVIGGGCDSPKGLPDSLCKRFKKTFRKTAGTALR